MEVRWIAVLCLALPLEAFALFGFAEGIRDYLYNPHSDLRHSRGDVCAPAAECATFTADGRRTQLVELTMPADAPGRFAMGKTVKGEWVLLDLEGREVMAQSADRAVIEKAWSKRGEEPATWISATEAPARFPETTESKLRRAGFTTTFTLASIAVLALSWGAIFLLLVGFVAMGRRLTASPGPWPPARRLVGISLAVYAVVGGILAAVFLGR